MNKVIERPNDIIIIENGSGFQKIDLNNIQTMTIGNSLKLKRRAVEKVFSVYGIYYTGKEFSISCATEKESIDLYQQLYALILKLLLKTTEEN